MLHIPNRKGSHSLLEPDACDHLVYTALSTVRMKEIVLPAQHPKGNADLIINHRVAKLLTDGVFSFVLAMRRYSYSFCA